MRLLQALHLCTTFAYFGICIPAPAFAGASVAVKPSSDLTEAIFKLTESRPAVRDVALAILERASGPIKRSASATRVDKSWYWYFPKPRQRPGIAARDDTAQIAQLLGQLEQSFAELARLISDQLGVPIPPASKSAAASSTLSCTHPPRSSTPNPTSLQTLTMPEAVMPSSRPQQPAVIPSSSVSLAIPSPAVSSFYTFDPNRPDLNLVYYAQSPATTSVPFLSVCNDSSVDIIILSFVTDFFTAGGYPTLNLASKCWDLDSNTAQGQAANAKGATGLIDCVSPGFAAQVAQCQATGKKVMLSLGGAKDYSNTAIPSQEKAVELAHTLWSLFLGGSDPNLTPLRPFGADVVLDGFDIDNENPSNAAYIPTLVSTLRSLFQSSHAAGSRAFYLSAAPECPRPDLSIPISSMLPNLDFVSVQFYNNPSCSLGSSGFISSLQSWSSDVANYGSFHNVGNGVSAPRLLIGAPADPAAATAGGYVDQSTWHTLLQQVKALGLSNLGGAMYWDGSYLELDKSGGQTFADVLREIL